MRIMFMLIDLLRIDVPHSTIFFNRQCFQVDSIEISTYCIRIYLLLVTDLFKKLRYTLNSLSDYFSYLTLSVEEEYIRMQYVEI